MTNNLQNPTQSWTYNAFSGVDMVATIPDTGLNNEIIILGGVSVTVTRETPTKHTVIAGTIIVRDLDCISKLRERTFDIGLTACDQQGRVRFMNIRGAELISERNHEILQSFIAKDVIPWCLASGPKK